MSVSATLIDLNKADQVATNKGWMDFVRWVEKLDKAKYPDLHRLTDEGICDCAAAAAKELRRAISLDTPLEDVLTTAKGFLGFLRGGNQGEPVIIEG